LLQRDKTTLESAHIFGASLASPLTVPVGRIACAAQLLAVAVRAAVRGSEQCIALCCCESASVAVRFAALANIVRRPIIVLACKVRCRRPHLHRD
jgi:hypothetical protein